VQGFRLFVECGVQRVPFIPPLEELFARLRVARVLPFESVGVDPGPYEVHQRPEDGAFRRVELLEDALPGEAHRVPEHAAREGGGLSHAEGVLLGRDDVCDPSSGSRATAALTFSIPAFDAATL